VRMCGVDVLEGLGGGGEGPPPARARAAAPAGPEALVVNGNEVRPGRPRSPGRCLPRLLPLRRRGRRSGRRPRPARTGALSATRTLFASARASFLGHLRPGRPDAGIDGIPYRREIVWANAVPSACKRPGGGWHAPVFLPPGVSEGLEQQPGRSPLAATCSVGAGPAPVPAA